MSTTHIDTYNKHSQCNKEVEREREEEAAEEFKKQYLIGKLKKKTTTRKCSYKLFMSHEKSFDERLTNFIHESCSFCSNLVNCILRNFFIFFLFLNQFREPNNWKNIESEFSSFNFRYCFKCQNNKQIL